MHKTLRRTPRPIYDANEVARTGHESLLALPSRPARPAGKTGPVASYFELAMAPIIAHAKSASTMTETSSRTHSETQRAV